LSEFKMTMVEIYLQIRDECSTLKISTIQLKRSGIQNWNHIHNCEIEEM
jgi:hypothetical protein